MKQRLKNKLQESLVQQWVDKMEEVIKKYLDRLYTYETLSPEDIKDELRLVFNDAPELEKYMTYEAMGRFWIKYYNLLT